MQLLLSLKTQLHETKCRSLIVIFQNLSELMEVKLMLALMD